MGPDGPLVPFQPQMDFWALGRTKRYRLYLAPNQFLGKTTAGVLECVYHLTGLYPDWWPGHRFTGPIDAWICGATGDKVRDTLQRAMFGLPGKLGTGFVPGELIDGTPTYNRGVTGLIENIRVRHVPTGKISSGSFKSYEGKVTRHASNTIELVYGDELTPLNIFNEWIARVAVRKGLIIRTVSPIEGLVDDIPMFYPARPGDPSYADFGYVHAGLEDNPTLTPDDIASIVAAYSPHERLARAMGLPSVGSGLIHIFPPETYVAPFDIPSSWRRIVGLDIGGGDHPTAAIWIAFAPGFPEKGDAIIYDEYRNTDTSIAIHAAAIKERGPTIPVAWPHDARKTAVHDGPAAGARFADLYRRHHINLCPLSARYTDDGLGGAAPPKGPIIQQINDLATAGRLKIFTSCTKIMGELQGYHTKAGKIVDYKDDLISAMHQGIMMSRYSAVETDEQATLPPPYTIDPFAGLRI